VTRTDDRTLLLIAWCAVILALRPVGWTATAVTLAVGAVGLFAGEGADVQTTVARWMLATGVGVAAFTFVRLRAAGPPMRATAAGIFASVVAGVAEEIFFRRLVYGRLQRYGASVAIAGSAAAFALVHVPGYGVRALPVDAAAGLVLGWQRMAAGTWTSPGVTHAFANLVAAA
jgi:membrane protease YdiL (CAAX protease family)